MPITLSEFEEHLGDISFPLAVAVSGGADSLALLLLAHEAAQKKGSYVVALTVDHQLRPESKEEALQVHQWSKERGIKHVILDWVHDNPKSRLQEKARHARYELLTQWCKHHQIATLLLGHHQQDQEETFWLRLTAGSGLDGLTGMKKRLIRNGITFLRPLLNFPKDRIKKTLQAKNQEWIEDPSNLNPRFFRGNLRNFLREEGLSSLRLHHTMNKLQQDADFIQEALHAAVESTVQIHEAGYLSLKREVFQASHPALAERLLSLVVQWYTGRPYTSRRVQITAVNDKINCGSPFTMGGIYWVIGPKEIFLFRESRAVQGQLLVSSLQTPTLWDQRFWVDPELKKFVSSETILKPLGSVIMNSSFDFAASQLRSERTEGGNDPEQENDLEQENKPQQNKPVRPERRHGVPKSKDRTIGSIASIPKRAWPTLPALWQKGKVVAVPHLCYDSLNFEKDLRNFFSIKPLFHDSLRITI